MYDVKDDAIIVSTLVFFYSIVVVKCLSVSRILNASVIRLGTGDSEFKDCLRLRSEHKHIYIYPEFILSATHC